MRFLNEKQYAVPTLTVDILEECLELDLDIGETSERSHVDGVHKQTFH